jgi:hypothetical protein
MALMGEMFTSVGCLKYVPNKLTLEVDQVVADYYRALLPKWIRNNPQKFPAHVSVVRRETPPRAEHWGRYEGELVEFRYSNVVEFDETYVWLNVECERLKEVRVELGLNAYPWWRNRYHVTIANFKGIK